MARKAKNAASKAVVSPAEGALPVPTCSPEITGENAGDDPRKATQFKPGESGNPAGRPKGSRHKLSESFLAALAKDFAANGEAAIKKVRDEEPAQYLRVVATMVPKAFDLGEDDEGNQIAGVALITKNAIDALIQRGKSDGRDPV